MVKFLINRPIAVIMSFLALIFLGLLTIFKIPVSLMPDIDIPEITVQIKYPSAPARTLESSIVTPIRRQLLQVGHLKDIESETRDGYALIRMKYLHGTDIEYAYIECNEKIDQALNENNLPRDMDRPRVIKASATDIPVFNLLITRKSDWQDENRFMQLSDFVRSVIIKRIEQLPEVAMVDITGYTMPGLDIRPDFEKLQSLGLTENDILNAIERNNLTIGSLMVREGYYQYHINFANYLRNVEDIGNIYLGRPDHLMQLKDLADLKIVPQDRRGLFLNRNKNGLCLSVIKQSDERMADLKKELKGLVEYYRTTYPGMDFEIEKDQTKLLEYSIGNLRQSLLFGATLAILVMFLFLKDFRSPVLIAFTIPVSLVISFLFFYLLHISINIISLSGLILAVGMMIDNSIIVIDNINQYRDQGETLNRACVLGTNEVIRPLISSALTTCAVFVPLVFLSGLAGALFFDQAVAVSTGLFVSFAVSITLLPMLFRLFYFKKPTAGSHRFLARINRVDYEKGYDQSFNHVFRYRRIYSIAFLVAIPLAVWLFHTLKIRSFPEMQQTESVAVLDWNEPVHVTGNARRVRELTAAIPDTLLQYSSEVGEQQFFLNRRAEQIASEAEIYLRTQDPASVERIQNSIKAYLGQHYPMATVSFYPPENIFEALFSEDLPPLLARISSSVQTGQPSLQEFNRLLDSISREKDIEFTPVPVQDQIVIEVDPEKLLLYQVDFSTLYNQLQTAFNQRPMGVLKSYQQYIPIILGNVKRPVAEVINRMKVSNRQGQKIPVASMVRLNRAQQYKSIRANRHGEFVPLELNTSGNSIPGLMGQLNRVIKQFPDLEISYDGTWFRNSDLIRQLAFVLGISVLLLFFILAAQFESFIQPLIVLLEIPIDFAGALFLLWIFGGSVNVMSAIGIVVMSGIIINDSILKIDTINRARREGAPLLEAIHIGGRRRLKPIIMTSLTTILALLPFLFFKGLGAELQKPLALTVIGGMTIGTLVSLYFIPLAYWAIYRKIA